MILIEAEAESFRIKTVVQNAETIRLVTPTGSISVSELKVGDTILARLEEGGRHFGALVRDEPVIVHCYTTPVDIEHPRNLAELGSFCRRMGREARQGEVGLVIGDEYFAIRDFGEE